VGSTTVTMNEAEPTLPMGSVAQQVTVVWPSGDTAARAMSVAIQQGRLGGNTLGEAVRSAGEALRGTPGQGWNGWTWGLFGREDSRFPGVAAGMLAPAFESALDPSSFGHFALLRTARDLWPDFAEADFNAALAMFSARQRRFGGR